MTANSLMSVAIMKVSRAAVETAAKKTAKKPKAKKAAAKTKKRKAAKKSAAATKRANDAKVKAARKRQSDHLTALILQAAKKPTSEEGFNFISDAVSKFKADMKASGEKISSKAVVDGVNAAGKKLAVPAKLKAGTPVTSALNRVVSIVMDHYIAGKEREENLKKKDVAKAARKGKGLPGKKPVSAVHAVKVAAFVGALNKAEEDGDLEAVTSKLEGESDEVVKSAANAYLNDKVRRTRAKAMEAIASKFKRVSEDGSLSSRIAKVATTFVNPIG